MLRALPADGRPVRSRVLPEPRVLRRALVRGLWMEALQWGCLELMPPPVPVRHVRLRTTAKEGDAPPPAPIPRELSLFD